MNWRDRRAIFHRHRRNAIDNADERVCGDDGDQHASFEQLADREKELQIEEINELTGWSIGRRFD